MYKLLVFSLIVILSMMYTGCSNETVNSINVWILGMQTTVYNELQVTEQWQEVDLLKPLDSGSPVHYIVLKLKDAQDWQVDDGKNIKNSQGQSMNIEVQLIDESGVAYELIPDSSRSGEIEFWIDYERGKNGEKFPKPVSDYPVGDVTFKKLKMKSNHPFTCTQIIWERHQL